MTRLRFAVVGLVTLLIAGCASEAQFLNNMQPMAVQTAESRGRFELNCPNAEAVVLSREVVQPVLQGPFIGAGLQRAEYSVGVSGCGARKTFVVICPDGGDGCFAAGPGRFFRE